MCFFPQSWLCGELGLSFQYGLFTKKYHHLPALILSHITFFFSVEYKTILSPNNTGPHRLSWYAQKCSKTFFKNLFVFQWTENNRFEMRAVVPLDFIFHIEIWQNATLNTETLHWTVFFLKIDTY